MAKQATTFDAYKAQLSGLPPDKFIGVIVWFTVNESRVTRDEVEQMFLDRDLDERFIPNPIKAVDAFRRSTSALEHTYTVTDDEDSGATDTATLRIREVDYDDERVIQHVIRERRDRKSKKLVYTQVGEALFFRQSRTARRKGVGGESVKFSLKRSALGDNEFIEAEGYINKVHQLYERNKGFLTSSALRGMVRNYVISLNAISVRPSGGVYFVHRTRIDTVNALAEVVEALGNGSMLHMLPLIDNGEQREMLTEAFQDEVEEHCDRLMKMVGEINDKHPDAVPAKKYGELREALDDMMERADEYTKVLGLAQNRSASSIELTMNALMEMATKIQAPT